MNGSSRICGILDDELSRHLSFTFSVTENLARPGSLVLRPGDRFRFAIWAVNRSDIVLAWLRGSVSSTGSASFTPLPFAIPRLSPGERVELGVIEARALKKPGVRFVRLDTVGAVSVAISPDLSECRVRKIKPLVLVQSRAAALDRQEDDIDSVAS